MSVISYATKYVESDLGNLRTLLSSNMCGADYEVAATASAYPTRLSGIHFGSVGIVKHEGHGYRCGYRRLNHIRADHLDDFLISVPIVGHSTALQMGEKVDIKPGQFAILTTSKPFVISITSEGRHSNFVQYTTKVSGSLLRARVQRIDAYCHNPIKITSGTGEIMTAMFALALQAGGALSASQSRVFESMLIDAIANCTRDAPELSGLLPETRQSSLARIREEAEHFIAGNISNPKLDPVLIAEHCNVSLRYLYEAFAVVSKKLGGRIRETRLERCRAALQSPDLKDRSIFEVALRWGFNDPAYFSRAYKARFGKTPREDRHIE